MNYKYIWFDLGMTLVESQRGMRYQRLLYSLGTKRSQEEIDKAYHFADKLFMREYPHVLGQSPEQFLPWYIGVLNYRLRVQLPILEVYKRLMESQNEGKRWRLIPGAAETLKRLKSRGCHTGLISNWDGSCRRVLRENGLDALLDTVVISSEAGMEKPEEGIFRLALEQAGASPEESLYVGDNYYDDAVGAAKAGISCVLINPYGREGIEELAYPRVIPAVSALEEFLEGEGRQSQNTAGGKEFS